MAENGDRDRGPGIGGRKINVDPALDELLASLVTPAARVDLRASVLRRIEEGRDSRAAVVWWPWTWRPLTLAAAAAIILMATAVVLWRGSSPQPSGGVARSAKPAPAGVAHQAGPALQAERAPNEAAAETAVARVEPSAPTRSAGKQRASPAEAGRDVTEALPPLEAPAPLQVLELTTDLLTPDALEIERLRVPPPIVIAPLDNDRGRNPQR